MATLATSAIAAFMLFCTLKNAREKRQCPPLRFGTSVTLDFRINCLLHKRPDPILDGVGGSAFPGRILAIMGPSGSGKTTLLHALAGRLAECRGMSVRGMVLANGVPIPSGLHPDDQAVVYQQDLFYSFLTARETLLLEANLRRRPQCDSEGLEILVLKETHVEMLLQRLGLGQAADTIVGNELTRGLSGGERKRLNIGTELISDPQVIFADEPTSGLDAFQAEQTLRALKQLATDGKTVLCTLHQPSVRVWRMIDDLLLLSEGRVLYSGPADEAVPYFRHLFVPAPSPSPAALSSSSSPEVASLPLSPSPYDTGSFLSFLTDEALAPPELISVIAALDFSTKETEAASRTHIDYLARAWKDRKAQRSTVSIVNDPISILTIPDNASPEQSHAHGTPRTIGQRLFGWFKWIVRRGQSWSKQFFLLLQRGWRQILRDKLLLFLRFGVSVGSALVIGAVYHHLPLTQASIQSRLGLLNLSVVWGAMTSCMYNIYQFPKERAIVDRERAKGSYSPIPYFFSKLVSELPTTVGLALMFSATLYPLAGLNKAAGCALQFGLNMVTQSLSASGLGLLVGALAPSMETSLAIGPSCMVLFVLFGGYSINEENIPLLLRWIPKISLIRWSFEAGCLTEFAGLRFGCHSPFDVRTGEQVLDRLSFGNCSVTHALRMQLAIAASYYTATCLALRFNGPTFLQVEPDTGTSEEKH